MKTYQIKPEHIEEFGSGCPSDGIVTEDQLNQYIEYLGAADDIMDMVTEVDYEPTDDLRQDISETYDSSTWEPVTGILYKNDEPFQIHKFSRDVEYEHKTIRVLIITRTVYDRDDPTAVDYSEDLLFYAWVI